MQHDVEVNASLLSLLFGTKQGQVVLTIALLYTLIVSLTLAVLYFATGLVMTVLAITGYVVFTTAVIFFRAPSPQLMYPAITLISGIPVIGSVLLIAIAQLFI